MGHVGCERGVGDLGSLLIKSSPRMPLASVAEGLLPRIAATRVADTAFEPQLRRAFFPALLPNRLAHDFFLPVPAYGTDQSSFGPTLTPHRRFCGRDAVQVLTSREPFDPRDHLGRLLARPRLPQTMAMF